MAPRVETQFGTVEGRERADHLVFRGIPYARPPVDKLRFQPPLPPAPWAGVRECKAFSKSAMQGLQFVPGDESAGAESEDCLYLNVFTRALGARKRPVMVWIHGGAYTVGSAALPIYDGGILCESGDVVVVTLNYRLGAFGFLYLGEIGERMDALPNLGLLDQVAALRWVQDNIASFGGDPGNVTIFGESAGATSVCALLVAKGTEGLFQRAISQSTALPLTLPKHAQAERTTALLLAKLGLSYQSAEQLRALPATAIAGAQRAIEAEELAWLGFFPVLHRDSLPEQPREVFAQKRARHVPLIAGFNLDEWNLFDAVNVVRWHVPMSRAELRSALMSKLGIAAHQAEQLIAGYAQSRREHDLPHHENALLRAILGDHRFGITSLRVAEAHAQLGAPVFAYRFHQRSPALRGALGACHALEIPFVFGTYGVPGQERFAGSGSEVEKLSRTMMHAWLSFAEQGVPTSLPDWEPYQLATRTTMVFAGESQAERDPFRLEREAWHGIEC